MKNITNIIALGKYGIVAIFSYFIFIIYIFIKNIMDETFNSKLNDLKLFSNDFGGVTGTFSLAFFLHNSIS